MIMLGWWFFTSQGSVYGGDSFLGSYKRQTDNTLDIPAESSEGVFTSYTPYRTEKPAYKGSGIELKERSTDGEKDPQKELNDDESEEATYNKL